VQQDPRQVRDRIGFLTGDMKLSGYLTPRELLRFFGELNHLDRETIAERSAMLSSYLAMDDFLDKPVAKLSSGMKQKSAIAVSLIHDPEVIIFDEPTAGLDLLASKTVVDFLHDSRERGRTVVLSTHIMAEAEQLCDTVGILIDGELRAEGSQRELIREYERKNLSEVFFHLAQGENARA
jgi:sodium transport system ATP-binding protein